jgi:DNA transformation protein
VIAKLANLGVKSAQMLADAGIFTEEQLRQVGSVGAYLMIKEQTRNASLNLLWALEGALTNRSWPDVAHEERSRLLASVEAHRDLDEAIAQSRKEIAAGNYVIQTPAEHVAELEKMLREKP